ncbi:hypothetical protein H8356DRAFT_1720079 [Neocallimastix lanati (nom. inval.)]|uniref:Mid2 domain-containing protein n=1 Tax=Neocallimastix californiae TaxID=1754190 RepID=A0A1Y2APU9_9FUNG|nr:hypothetical protein H8356DRAFT_1720079 [Neocallimastix sp. JGI-2020a]ORY24504.1 hypothetical protein LY90DRAFT_706538 [Neocallimastix californiae]|eukprot:ORY24504.1 hypothetical protein LY90DRAFT_706538 [Neocallimastix californiae]
MKFRTVLYFALAVVVTFSQNSDIEDNGINDDSSNNGIVSDVEFNQVPDFDDSANVSQQNVDADNTMNNGEVSDNYGDIAGINALDGGEASDIGAIATDENSSNEQPDVNAMNIPTTPQAVEFTGASGEAAPVAAALENQSASEESATGKPTVALDDETKKDRTIDPAKIASGLVGAAAISSAGIFFIFKRAKRRGLESVRSQISMA